MKLTIFNVYLVMDSQEQCDRMKQVCVDAGLDIYDNFNFNYLKKEYRFFYCSNGDFCNWLELEYDRDLTQVTEPEFLTLLNEYKSKEMETYYYKTVTIFEKYPFQTEVKERFVEFYVKSKLKGSKRYLKILDLKFNSDTSLIEKENYLKSKTGKQNIKLLKI